jgi:hypothetical protein
MPPPDSPIVVSAIQPTTQGQLGFPVLIGLHHQIGPNCEVLARDRGMSAHSARCIALAVLDCSMESLDWKRRKHEVIFVVLGRCAACSREVL